MSLKTVLIALLILIFGTLLTLVSTIHRPVNTTGNYLSAAVTPTAASGPAIVEPIAQFRLRITKKTFGTFVTPQHSPVYPERFTGFHTGVDIEYNDQTGNIPVYSIAAGRIIYSGYVTGYGGLIAIRYTLNNQPYIGLYGHLRPSSLLAANQPVKIGQQIAVLGTAYSWETSGERRHLHFALLKGNQLDLRGYVPKQSELAAWVNPLDIIK